jgi:SAM-dependent methyltransferase
VERNPGNGLLITRSGKNATRGASLTQEISPELAENLEHFRTASAIAEYSYYALFPEEEYFFSNYYKAGESVLDLGCGMGRTTLLLYEAGLTVRGVDRSEVFIETAKRRFPYLDLRTGSFDRIEEADSSFCHVLVSFNSLDYAFPESQRIAALQECVRVLKPGGTLIFSSHNAGSLHWYSPHYLRKPLWKLRNAFRGFRRGTYVFEDGLHTYFASAELVIRQTEALGVKFLEMNSASFRRIGVESLDRYFAPYIHYAFRRTL